MKKLWLAVALLLSWQTVGMSGGPVEPVKIATFAGTTGLAMVKLMEGDAIAGLPCNYQVFKNPDPVLGKLIAGELDLAGLPTNMAAILYNKGVEIEVLSIIGWGVMYVVSSDPAIKDWSDLKGKEIYVSSKGAVSDLLFQYLASKNGLSGEDLKIQYVASAVEIAQLTAAGKAAITVLPEPWVTEVLEKNPRVKVALDCQKEWKRVEKRGLTYPQTCVVVRKKFAREHPEFVKEFRKELAKSIKWLGRKPEEGGVLAEKYVQVPAVAVQKGWSRCNLKYADAFKVRTEIDLFLERLGQFAKDAVGGKTPDEGFYYRP